MKRDYKMNNVLEYLEHSAQLYPDKTAFADERETETFAGLQEKAMRIGSGLKPFALHKEAVVILMDARHVPSVTTLLGVLYSGCFYVPLDPASPADRLQMIFEQLEPALIIYDAKAFAAKTAFEDRYRFAAYEELIEAEIDEAYLEEMREESNAFDPLFIMYTSGSTGVPKGVLHTHGQLIDYTEFTYRRYPFDENTVFGNQSPFFYANCLLDIYPPLAVGATVHILPSSLLVFPKKMVERLVQLRITELCMTPSSFNAVAQAGVLTPGCLPDLRFILPSGETINGKAMKVWEEAAPGAGHYWNFYGSTELLSASLFKVNRDYDDDENVPSGIPYHCTHILIMDENGNELPRGEKGEMWIHNPWMFSGYYRDRARTEAAFVNDPLGKGYNELFFKTGDMGYINEQGELVVTGRKDSMIKHNGYRMELGEVEYAAKGIGEVQECCCIWDRESGKISLFYTGKIGEKELAKQLKGVLPRFALPDRIMWLEHMPHNANMKADRKALALI